MGNQRVEPSNWQYLIGHDNPIWSDMVWKRAIYDRFTYIKVVDVSFSHFIKNQTCKETESIESSGDSILVIFMNESFKFLHQTEIRWQVNLSFLIFFQNHLWPIVLLPFSSILLFVFGVFRMGDLLACVLLSFFHEKFVKIYRRYGLQIDIQFITWPSG